MITSLGSGIEIVRLHEPDDDAIDGLVELQRLVDAEFLPDDPPVTHEEVAGRLRHVIPEHRSLAWMARDGEEVVGWVTALMDQRSANAGFVELEDMMVRPGWRRRGIGTALVRTAAAELASVGATSVMIWPVDDGGSAFCEALGLTHRQVERQSRLRVAAVDDSMMADWIAAPKARAAGFRVETWIGAVPDEHLDEWLVAVRAMADAPLDDLDWHPDPPTAEWVRANEAVKAARGDRRVCSLALAPDGTAAGMTMLMSHSARPQVVYQGDTAVVPAHRGFGLGRWLKAANLAALLAAQPEVELVDTWNAETNDHMLAINVAMGFRPLRQCHAYQAPVADLAGSG